MLDPKGSSIYNFLRHASERLKDREANWCDFKRWKFTNPWYLHSWYATIKHNGFHQVFYRFLYFELLFVLRLSSLCLLRRLWGLGVPSSANGSLRPGTCNNTTTRTNRKPPGSTSSGWPTRTSPKNGQIHPDLFNGDDEKIRKFWEALQFEKSQCRRFCFRHALCRKNFCCSQHPLK